MDMKRKKKRLMTAAIAVLLVLQMLVLNQALAVAPDDIDRTDPGDVSEVVEVDESASYVEITDHEGNPILPDGPGGDYSDVPLDARITIHYEFRLPDDNGKSDSDPDYAEYSYLAGDTYLVQLPVEVEFDVPAGGAELWTNEHKTTSMGTVTIDASGLATFTFNAYVKEHSDLTGWFEIDGVFKSGVTDSGTPVSITIGAQTIIITPADPPPPVMGLAKQGVYNAAANEITWTVTVTVPNGETVSGVSLEDVYSDNQEYVPDFFTVNKVVIDEASPELVHDSANRKLTYSFPAGISGTQEISYKTAPAAGAFAAENGTAESTVYGNTATLKVDGVTNGEPKTASVTLDWISKSGQAAGDLTAINWTVTAGIAGQTITGATITDTLPAGLALIPGSVRLGGPTGTQVAADTVNPPAAGNYYYDAGTRVLVYHAGTLTGPISLYYSTEVTDRTAYLNNNGEILFENGAELSWTEGVSSGSPGDQASAGIGEGGLLAKSAGAKIDYNHATTRIIHWTITVNRNGIAMPADTQVTDTIPAGQKFLPDTFVVKNNAGSTVASAPTASTDNSFTYTFPAPINEKHTITFDTEITDAGLVSLYVNDDGVAFGNSAWLSGTGVTASAGGSQKYGSQVIDKGVHTAYNYDTRTMTWEIVVNRNQLTMTDTVVTDTLPAGLEFLPATFTVTPSIAGAAADALTYTVHAPDDIASQDSFTYAFPDTIDRMYTITFDTKVKETFLMTQGDKTFTNEATLEAAEIPAGITVTASHVVRNPVVTKTGTYVTGADSIDWAVVINSNRLTLQDVSLTDDLPAGLRLDTDSIRLYQVELQSNGTWVKRGAALPASLYEVAYDLDPAFPNRFTFTFVGEISEVYQLEFVTDVLVSSMTVNNEISFAGTGIAATGTSDQMVISVSDQGAGGSGSTGSITIHKVDAAEPTISLGGARFALLNINRDPIPGKQATTDGNGLAVFGGLLYKTYYIKETEPPAGYLLDAAEHKFRLKAGDDTFTYMAENAKATGIVSFSKRSADGSALGGGTFTLTGTDYAGNAVSLTASAVGGTVTFTDVPLGRPGEAYVITETEPPAGHDPSTDTLTATVEYNADKTGVTVQVTPDALINTPLPGTVFFSKTGADGAPLTGGTFTLTGTDYASNTVSMTASAVGGTVTFVNVPIGSYTIAETDPPEGYLLPGDTDILTATVEYNETNTGVVTTVRELSAGAPVVSAYINTPALGSISFTKTTPGGSPLTGGTFTLTGTDYAGNAVSLTASSVAGTVTFTDVPLGNNYTIRETVPPAGYIRSNVELTASVTYNGDKTATVTNVDPDTLANKPESETVYGNIELTKTDEGGRKLAGATFGLYRQSDGSLMATAVSNSQGVARFSKVPEGRYFIKETGAPAGYILSQEAIDVDITGTATRTFTIVNRAEEGLTGSIEIIKTDDAGNALAGAEFTLYDAEGSALQTVVTGPDGRAVFEAVSAGAYTVFETRAPEGYATGTGSTAITVSSGQTVSLTFTNWKIATDSGSMQIKKVDQDANPLAGAELTLYNESGTAISKAVSGEDGFVLFTGLLPGRYSVRETAAPEGYELFTEPLTFAIRTGQALAYTLRNNLLTDDGPEILGWKDDNAPAPGGTLPQTGGVSATLYISIAGLILLSVGFLLAKPKRYRRNNKM